MKRHQGRPKAEWQKKLLDLKNHKNKEISLAELEKKLDLDRKLISQTLSRITTARKDILYDTQKLYAAIKKKLEGDKT